jgi:acyl-CoA thioester hydrolase
MNKFRIYYHHTDCGGVVYYGTYLKFLEEARSDFLEEKGLSLKKLAEEGTLFVVARQEIDYKYPAFYADTLTVETRIGQVSGVRIEFLNEIKNQDRRLIAKARTILVCVGQDLKPKSLPETVRSRLI